MHLKNIWHNALKELISAEKIVFIGYSFPDADFEMRCMLKKAIQQNTQIEVVLHRLDNPKYYINNFKKLEVKTDFQKSILEHLNLPENRYKAFFGDKNIKFYYNGIEGYIYKEMKL